MKRKESDSLKELKRKERLLKRVLRKMEIEEKDLPMFLKNGMTTFHKEFRKHMADFITGAFAFVAALLWRDAVNAFIQRYESYITTLIPMKETWIFQVLVAFMVSVIAVIAIIVVSRLLKPS